MYESSIQKLERKTYKVNLRTTSAPQLRTYVDQKCCGSLVKKQTLVVPQLPWPNGQGSTGYSSLCTLSNVAGCPLFLLLSA